MAIIIIDFDNTITTADTYPEISPVRPHAKEVINRLYAEGHCIIINTCRCDSEQERARSFLIENNIHFCHINENCRVRINQYHNDTRKIGGHISIDDKNIECLDGGGIDWINIEKMLNNILTKNRLDHTRCLEREYN